MESDTRPDVPHWHAGFNRPGFLPESEPGVFSSFEAAREALADDREIHAAAEATWADEHDCDDVPCPTYGDSCAWDRANAVRAERETLLASDGPSWEGGTAGLAYWVKPCGEARCVDELVARTAAEFADAHDSPLGVLASTGAIVDGAAEEADESRPGGQRRRPVGPRSAVQLHLGHRHSPSSPGLGGPLSRVRPGRPTGRPGRISRGALQHANGTMTPTARTEA